MKKLILLILFYWVLLIENGTNWISVLFDLGNGLEVRLTLIFQVLFLVTNILIVLKKNQKVGKIKFLLFFMLFLFLSTIYVGIAHPQHFVKALSVNFHIQLVLNIILYIYWTKLKEEEISKFYNWLRFFGLFNAILVIISFFFPTLTSFFQAGTSETGVTRAFGIMGDEVSLFLTFFFFDSLISQNKFKAGLFAIAILCTGGIGAFFTLLVLIGYYNFYIRKISSKNIIQFSLFVTLIFGGILTFSDKFYEITVIKRIMGNIYNPELETGNFRLLSLSTAFEMSKDNPILGAGYGAYGFMVDEKYGNLTTNENAPIYILRSAFNPYIQMICEAGIIGFFFFIYFLRGSLKICKPKNDDSSFSTSFKTSSHGWLLIFFLTCLSANWFLPASFLFLLTATLIGLNLKLNELRENEQSIS